MVQASSTSARPAVRTTVSRWTQPRLALGVALVCSSVVIGALLFASSDDTQEFWSVTEPVRAGTPVDVAVLSRSNARLDASAGQTLVAASETIGADAIWTTDLAVGSLVPRSALSSAGEAGYQLPITVSAGALPPDLREGDTIDVWVGPGPQDDPLIEAERVLEGVRVISTSTSAVSIDQTLVVDAGPRQPQPALISSLAASHVTIVRLP